MPSLKPRYEEFSCPDSIFPVEDGDDPFCATVRINLTFEELDALPQGDSLPYAEMRDAIAPYITAWNWTATDTETGDEVPVPPPAEAGPDVLRTLTREMVLWLFNVVRLGFQGGDKRKKASPPLADTDAPDSEPSKGSATSSRKRQGG